MTELVLLGVIFVLSGLNAWGQLRQFHERKQFDAERRSYVAAALAAQTNNQAAAAVIRPKAERPEPAVARPVQLDL